jgi:hypothetical protein
LSKSSLWQGGPAQTGAADVLYSVLQSDVDSVSAPATCWIAGGPPAAAAPVFFKRGYAMNWSLILFGIAVVLFVLAAIGVQSPPRYNLTAAGLAFVAAGLLLAHAGVR